MIKVVPDLMLEARSIVEPPVYEPFVYEKECIVIFLLRPIRGKEYAMQISAV
jgi:hypothetical protein